MCLFFTGLSTSARGLQPTHQPKPSCSTIEDTEKYNTTNAHSNTKNQTFKLNQVSLMPKNKKNERLKNKEETKKRN